MAQAGIDGRLSLGYTENATSMTKELCADIGGGTRLKYQIIDTERRFLHPDATVAVYVDDVLQTTGYTAYRAGGIVVFDNAQAIGAVVTISAKYIPMVDIASAKSFSLDAQWGNEDVTTFPTGASSAWGKNALMMKSATGSIEVFTDGAGPDEWHDAMFGDTSETPDWVGGSVLGIQFGDVGATWTLYILAYPTGLTENSSATGMATETINFTIANDPPYLKA